jgi:hypothetical protein
MAQRYKIVQGDTRHAWQMVLTLNGLPVTDLTPDDRVYLRMRLPDAIERKIDNVEAILHDPAGAEVWYAPRDQDVDQSGLFLAECEVVYADGRRATYPDDPIEMEIRSKV